MKNLHKFAYHFSLVLSLIAGLVSIQSGAASGQSGAARGQSGAASGQSSAASSAKDAAAVTFNKDIAPIFFKSCAECHRPGEAAPFAVLTYKETRPWAKSIREKVLNRTMPPWHADPHVG